jgi:hypothetical protein
LGISGWAVAELSGPAISGIAALAAGCSGMAMPGMEPGAMVDISWPACGSAAGGLGVAAAGGAMADMSCPAWGSADGLGNGLGTAFSAGLGVAGALAAGMAIPGIIE